MKTEVELLRKELNALRERVAVMELHIAQQKQHNYYWWHAPAQWPKTGDQLLPPYTIT